MNERILAKATFLPKNTDRLCILLEDTEMTKTSHIQHLSKQLSACLHHQNFQEWFFRFAFFYTLHQWIWKFWNLLNFTYFSLCLLTFQLICHKELVSFFSNVWMICVNAVQCSMCAVRVLQRHSHRGGPVVQISIQIFSGYLGAL